MPGVPGRAAAHPAHAVLVRTQRKASHLGFVLPRASPVIQERGPGLEATGSPSRAVPFRRLQHTLRLIEGLGPAPSNSSLQRTRVPSSRFFQHCGSPLSSVSLGTESQSMSLERSVFAPVERVANALHPHRWRIFAATFVLFLAPFLFALAERSGWELSQLHCSPFIGLILAALVAWGWSAFALATSFGPSRPLSSLSSGGKGSLWLALRFWALIFVAMLVLLPVAMCLVVLLQTRHIMNGRAHR